MADRAEVEFGSLSCVKALTSPPAFASAQVVTLSNQSGPRLSRGAHGGPICRRPDSGAMKSTIPKVSKKCPSRFSRNAMILELRVSRQSDSNRRPA